MAGDKRRTWIEYVLPMLMATGLLVLFGVQSISVWATAQADEPSKQLLFLGVAAGAMLALQLVDYRDLLRFSVVLYVLALIPVAYTVAGKHMALPFVRPVNGAYAWIQLGPVSIEPSEVAKVTLVMALAWLFRDKQAQRERPIRIAAMAIAMAGAVIALVLQQPALGMALTIFWPVVVLFAISELPRKVLLVLAAGMMLAVPLAWFSGRCTEVENCPICPNVPVLRYLPQIVKHYQRRRVYSLFSNDPKVMERGGYQQLRALEAIGSGGPWGKGRGNVSAAQHVPEAHTDMILALIGEQYGFAGVATVLLTYCLLFTAGLAVAGAQQEPAGRLLAVGLVVLMAGQMMFNVGVVFRLLPVTGLTLPFISYGGSSLVANCAIVGLLINIARHQRRRIF